MTGYQKLSNGKTSSIKGRSVVTVNYYMTTIAGMFQFATDNGYTSGNPFNGLAPLKKSKVKPDPLTRDEFIRFIEACRHQQTKTCGFSLYTRVFVTGSWYRWHGKI